MKAVPVCQFCERSLVREHMPRINWPKVFCGALCFQGFAGHMDIDEIDAIRNKVRTEKGLPLLEPR